MELDILDGSLFFDVAASMLYVNLSLFQEGENIRLSCTLCCETELVRKGRRILISGTSFAPSN